MTSAALNKMIAYFGSDVRRVNHTLKVYGFAQTICATEGLDGERIQIVELAAILHDIGIPEAERKHGSSAGPYQEEEGRPIARKLLAEVGAPPEAIDRVCHIVGNHHSYDKIDGIDFQIIVEADFLVNAFEDGMEKAAIRSVGNKLFRTNGGRALLFGLYLGGGSAV